MAYSPPTVMPEEGYTAVTVPRALWNAIRALPLGKLGYANGTEVVKEALREKLRTLESLPDSKDRRKGKA